jgi:MYXO-CTERM domain-containing protein
MKTANNTKLALHLGGTRVWVLGSLVGWVVAGVGCHSSSQTNDEQDRTGHLKADDVDGGELDAEEIDAEAIDAEAIDAEAIDAEAIDAEAIDAESIDGAEAGAQGTVDGQTTVDTADRNDGWTTGADVPVLPPIDAIVIDTQVDVGLAEAGARVDVGPIVDVATGADQARNPDLAPTADTAVPSPDVAQPSPDTALPTNADAAPTPVVSPYQPGGGGFCAIAPAGTASPAAFLLLALAGLALLRRRR